MHKMWDNYKRIRMTPKKGSLNLSSKIFTGRDFLYSNSREVIDFGNKDFLMPFNLKSQRYAKYWY